MTRPEMAVVLVTPDGYSVLRRTVRHLARQTARQGLEVLIAAPARDGLELDPRDLEGFHSVRVVETGALRPAAAKTAAVEAALAPVVAFGEEHCFPEPGWAEALLSAHGRGWAGVGPSICNANPETAVSWAQFLMGYSRWAVPVESPGPIDALPWHNSSYKTDVLRAYGAARLGRLMRVEGLLQADLLSRGHRLFVEAEARIHHVNISRLSSDLSHAFLGGRLYGAARASEARWPVLRRMAYAGAAPLVPMVRLRRLAGPMRRLRREHALPARVLPALVASLVAHAAGELVGYAAGEGNAEHLYAAYELRRLPHLTDRERPLLLPDGDEGEAARRC